MDSPLQIIHDKVVKPAMDRITRECEGIITYVHYTEQTVNVRWNDHMGGSYTESHVSLPKEADGIYRQSPKIGDHVKVSFVNGMHTSPYISILYKDNTDRGEYRSRNGAGIMKGMNYLFGGK